MWLGPAQETQDPAGLFARPSSKTFSLQSKILKRTELLRLSPPFAAAGAVLFPLRWKVFLTLEEQIPVLGCRGGGREPRYLVTC